ncbi:MAG: helix-turn-helix domain-containing protein [Xenococcaceae cyanobacterium]
MSSNISTKEDTLKTLIEGAGYTQKGFAKELGLSLSTVTFYIAGEKLPRIDRFMEMARKLKVSPKTLARSIGVDISGIPDDL